MDRKEEWRRVLDIEVKRWSAMSLDELISGLRDGANYGVDLDSKKYQVELEVLEITEKYIHVVVAVDDGSVPASFRPLSRSFFCATT
jgi:hypothetical protein